MSILTIMAVAAIAVEGIQTKAQVQLTTIMEVEAGQALAEGEDKDQVLSSTLSTP